MNSADNENFAPTKHVDTEALGEKLADAQRTGFEADWILKKLERLGLVQRCTLNRTRMPLDSVYGFGLFVWKNNSINCYEASLRPLSRNLFEDFDIDIDETTQEETTHANTAVHKTVSGRFKKNCD